MKVYVNFGEWAVDQAEAEGFDGIRTDVPASWPDIKALVQAFQNMRVRPLFLLHDVALNEPLLDAALPVLGRGGFDIEVFNEPPALDHVTDEQYVEGIWAVRRDCRARGFFGRVISGGLANVSANSIDRMRKFVPKLPLDITVGFHRYSYKTQTDWERPWPPFSNRKAEIDELHRIANGRPIACTEFGYHTAEEIEGFFIWNKAVRLTDEGVYARLVSDLKFYASNRVVLAAIYQWRDGLSDDFLGRYGLHTADGAHKRQLDAVKDWRV